MATLEINALPQRQRGPRIRNSRPGGKAPSRGIQMARQKPLPPVPRRKGNKPLPQLPRQNKRKPRRRNPGGSGPRNPMGRGFPSGNYPRGTRWCRVEEDEYITDIAGSIGFATTAFPVNPGQAGTFPWLSKQAAQWEKYRWEYLEFYYRPEVSAFATQGQAGKIILSMDYDAADAPPASKQQAEDTDPHTDAMPYEDLLLALDPRQMFEMADSKYVRPGGLPGSTDIKTYDSGNLSVSTIANTNTSLLGELHVRYAVIFEVPVLEAGAGNPAAANNQVAWFQSIAAEAAGATTVPTTVAVATATNNGIGAVNTAGSIVLPAGNYLVDYYLQAFNTVSGDTTKVIADLQVGGVTVWKSGPPTFANSGIAGGADVPVYGSVFVTLNGTQALTLVATISYSGGVETMVGSVRITAI